MFTITKMRSKREQLLELFFNSPRHWHFEELRTTVNIGKPQLARWLRILEQEHITKRIKIPGKMPYYLHNFTHPAFKNQKRLFAWKKMLDSGLLDHLAVLSDAKVIIIFGSFTREDWYEDSDIDIFIYGQDQQFEQGKYELRLGREIQVHTSRNPEELQKINNLLPYIIEGDFVKGSFQDLKVGLHAQT